MNLNMTMICLLLLWTRSVKPGQSWTNWGVWGFVRLGWIGNDLFKSLDFRLSRQPSILASVHSRQHVCQHRGLIPMATGQYALAQ